MKKGKILIKHEPVNIPDYPEQWREIFGSITKGHNQLEDNKIK